MSRFRSSLIAGALVAMAAACEEAAAPKGTPADLPVRAYVDRDASGTFNAGDSALAGVQISVAAAGTRQPVQLATATTNASGLATFADLAPGSYTISMTGGQPAGAVLTTNPTPTIGVSSQGTITGAPEFRFSFFPGTVSGRIFRDDDNSGGYTTGDVVGAGLTVRLRADTGQAGAVLQTTTTSSTGEFSFRLLAPGSYWVELENPTTISYGSAGALRRVTVGPQGTIAVPGVFTGSLVKSIADARDDAPGASVAVAGRITAAPGSFTSASNNVNGANSEIWVQDATGGIAVFPVATATAGLALGDSVTVSGAISSFAGQVQIGNPVVVTRRAAGTAPAPRVITGEQLVARTFEGQLVRLQGFTVTAIQTGTAANFNVTGTTDDGRTIVVRVTGPTTTGTPVVQNTGLTRADFVVGQRYAVTGIATVNITTATPPVTTIQIKPRFREDVTPAPLATPARVIINEFMANPNTVNDDAGEWVELHNTGGTDQNLQGWIIADNGGTNRKTIDVPLVVPAGGYVVLGINANRTTNGNVPVDFQFSGALPNAIALAQAGDRIVLYDASGVTVDSVSFTSTNTALVGTAGVAWGVVNPALENADVNGGNWVAQTTVYNTSGANSDRGTPKARNDGAVTTLVAPSTAPVRATRAPGGATSNRR